MSKDTNKVTCCNLMLLLSFCFLISCNQQKAPRQIERSFYYWKSNLNLSSFEKSKLKELDIKTIYIKFFDIDWNTQQQKAIPIAKLTTNENSLTNVRETKYVKTLKFNVIPTIFITNETFINIDTSNIESLVNNTYNLITNTISQNAFDNIGGIQFDCDWTESTKEKYFIFLSAFKKIYANSNMEISATIRLHQIKFFGKTGIPPVHKGLLMCYNMGNLKNPATNNSIIDVAELKKYIGNLSAYPLQLDVAFPLFEWNALFRKNIYNGILRDFNVEKISSSLYNKKDNFYTLLKDTTIQDYDFVKGDIIRNEKSNYNTILEAADAINSKLKNTQLRVSLYHLDSVILTKYTTHELETIYNRLR